jgi:cytochrome c-type biogenesis protein CcmH/NrfF
MLERLSILGIISMASSLSSPQLLAASTSSDQQQNLDAMAHAVEETLIAPCCFMQTLSNHSSPLAEQLKREIRDLLHQGWSVDEVRQYYLKKYGERILAMPQPRGFNVLAYVIPPLILAIATAAVVLWIRRHRAKPCTATGTHGETSSNVTDQTLVEQMHAELARFE